MNIMSDGPQPKPRDNDDDTESLFQLFKPRPDDPSSIRYLRAAVLTMGVVLVVVFVIVIGRIAYLVTRPVAVSSPPIAGAGLSAGPIAVPPGLALAPDIQLQLPPQSRLKSHTLSGNRLSVHYEAAAGEGIMILDLETGRALSHVRVKSARE